MTYIMIDDGSFDSFLTAIWLHVLAGKDGGSVKIFPAKAESVDQAIAFAKLYPKEARFFYTANEIDGVSLIEHVMKSGLPEGAVFYLSAMHLHDVKAPGVPKIDSVTALRFMHLHGSYPISEESALSYIVYSRGHKEELIPVIANWVREKTDDSLWDWIERSV